MGIDTATDEKNNDFDKTKPEEANFDGREHVDYDDLLSSAGEIGRYQIILFLASFPFYFFGVFVYYSQLFMTEVSPNHWCWIPELENLTVMERRNLAIPVDEENQYGYSRCRSYDANWTEVLTTGLAPNNSWSTTACKHGWEFDKSEIPYPSISSELGWVCEKDRYQATAQAIFFFGSMIGGFPVGWIADRFGRVPAAVVTNLVACVTGVASTFARSFIEFSACRFLMGMAGDKCMLIMYLLVLEYVGPKYRTIISSLSFAVFYCIAASTIPWIALICGNWKTFALATSLPMASVIIAPFVLPESPRWLLSKGRVDDTVKKILTIARINKRTVPAKFVEQFMISYANKKDEEKKSVVELMKRPTLRKVLICMCLEYMCCTVMFDSIIRSMGHFKFDFFMSFSLLALSEFPSVFILAFIMDKLGRRWITCTAMTMSCFFSILTIVVSNGLPSVICALIVRFFVNMSYGISELWPPEMMPTPVRGSATSVIHICGYGATILSPYISYLGTYFHWLPLLIVGCIATLGAIVALALPETANRKMPHDFNEAETLVKNQKFWNMPCLSRKREKDVGHNNDALENSHTC